MRLRGRFRDADSFMRVVRELQRKRGSTLYNKGLLADLVSRMSSRCILRFSPDEIQINVPKGIDAVDTWV
jgi:hypothetical protein